MENEGDVGVGGECSEVKISDGGVDCVAEDGAEGAYGAVFAQPE